MLNLFLTFFACSQDPVPVDECIDSSRPAIEDATIVTTSTSDIPFALQLQSTRLRV